MLGVSGVEQMCHSGELGDVSELGEKLRASGEQREGVLRLVLGFPVEMILSQPTGRRGTGEVG